MSCLVTHWPSVTYTSRTGHINGPWSFHAHSLHQEGVIWWCSKVAQGTFVIPDLVIQVKIVHNKIMDHKCALCDYTALWNVNLWLNSSFYRKMSEIKCVYWGPFHSINVHSGPFGLPNSRKSHSRFGSGSWSWYFFGSGIGIGTPANH